MNAGILELDLHGMRVAEARKLIDQQLNRVSVDVYRLRLIHGYHGGTVILNMIQDNYGWARHPKVIRIEGGWNQGITELVLREL